MISGAIAERMRFSAYVVFISLWAVLVYSPIAHWVWGGGWLAKMGALDFAGGEQERHVVRKDRSRAVIGALSNDDRGDECGDGGVDMHDGKAADVTEKNWGRCCEHRPLLTFGSVLVEEAVHSQRRAFCRKSADN